MREVQIPLKRVLAKTQCNISNRAAYKNFRSASGIWFPFHLVYSITAFSLLFNPNSEKIAWKKTQFYILATAIASSFSCFSLTSDGASVMTSAALVVFGKAMTSRILWRFPISMIKRSTPKAMPP